MDKTKEIALKMTVGQLLRQYGPGTVKHAGELPPLEVIPTGLPALDEALGIGGIPRGRIVEIYGPEGVGKTALAMHIAKQAGAALYIDADRSLAPAFVPDGVYVAHADTLEDALGLCKTAAPAFDLVVIDTLAALPTRNELILDMDDWTVAIPPAKVLSPALRALVGVLAGNGCTLILVNQLREKVGVPYGNPEKSTGGNALKHYASMRLDVRRLELMRENTETVGQRFKVNVVKNKCAAPMREAVVSLVYERGLCA